MRSAFLHPQRAMPAKAPRNPDTRHIHPSQPADTARDPRNLPPAFPGSPPLTLRLKVPRHRTKPVPQPPVDPQLPQTTTSHAVRHPPPCRPPLLQQQECRQVTAARSAGSRMRSQRPGRPQSPHAFRCSCPGRFRRAPGPTARARRQKKADHPTARRAARCDCDHSERPASPPSRPDQQAPPTREGWMFPIQA